MHVQMRAPSPAQPASACLYPNLPAISLWARDMGSLLASLPSTREPLLSSSENGTGGAETAPADGKSGGHWLGGSPEPRQDLSVPLRLPPQPGQSGFSATSCPSADQAQRASLLPSPSREVGQPCTPGPGSSQMAPLSELEKVSILQVSVCPRIRKPTQMPFFFSCSLSSASSAQASCPPLTLLKDNHLVPQLSAALGPAPPDPVPLALASTVPETDPVKH